MTIASKDTLIHRTFGVFALASSVLLLGASSFARAGEVFSTDFGKGTIDSQGYVAKGDWSVVDYIIVKSGITNNPGPVAKWPANGQTIGVLTKKFASTTGAFKLTFDAGYGWGGKDHPQNLSVMLLDDKGNGYIFVCMRASATWAAQYGNVTKYGYNDPLDWAASSVDTTQKSIVDGGGLRTFTVTRDATGKWTFNGDGWSGGPVTFTDTTTSAFTQIQLRGSANSDDIAFGKVKLEADTAK